MSIIRSLQTWLEGYDAMVLQVMTDSTDKNPSSYALAPSGNGKIISDILGNKTYQNNYIFYAKETAADEVDRRGNYDFLESLAEWMEEKGDAGEYPVLSGKYSAEGIEVSNAMLFDINDDGTGLYQVQIQLTLRKRSE